MKLLHFATIVLTALATIPAQAGQPSAGKSVAAPVPEKKDWSAELRIDGWMPQMNVGISREPTGLNKNIFLSLGDILSHVDWIVPVGGDIRYKRFGFMPDLYAARLSGSGRNPGGIALSGSAPLYSSTNLNLTTAILNLVGYYRLVDRETVSIDILGGARYLYIDESLTLSGGTRGSVSGPLSIDTTAHIWNGVGGLRYMQKLGDRLFLSFYGDIGAGASKLTWQVWTGLGYRFSKHLSLNAGYRYLTWEGGNNRTDIGLTASGPTLDLNWSF